MGTRLKGEIMKKSLLFIFCLFVSVISFAEDSQNFSPVYVTSESVFVPGLVQPRFITFNAPVGKNMNCITDITVSAANFPTTYSFYILDGQSGTTSYAIAQTSSSLVDSLYKDNPLCLSPGVTTYMYISSGSYKVNVFGYEKVR